MGLKLGGLGKAWRQLVRGIEGDGERMELAVWGRSYAASRLLGAAVAATMRWRHRAMPSAAVLGRVSSYRTEEDWFHARSSSSSIAVDAGCSNHPGQDQPRARILVLRVLLLLFLPSLHRQSEERREPAALLCRTGPCPTSPSQRSDASEASGCAQEQLPLSVMLDGDHRWPAQLSIGQTWLRRPRRPAAVHRAGDRRGPGVGAAAALGCNTVMHRLAWVECAAWGADAPRVD
ncbi:hypothetical protein BP5796_02501 [Coleophoma crateriformis]|uniref:Uncharacterized protein n=1 Tax=Coleophoma crateriformis TaxID=565419 RepID=A0A3D8SYG7_9HELO|nr:hypothetical protein BP5796_02501 [Coleophoma crateriformis]